MYVKVASCCFLIVSALILQVDASVASETATLSTLLRMTGGNTWLVKEGWTLTPENATTDSCSWFGVYCDLNGRVIEINLRRNNLVGNLTQFNFSAFPALTIFDVSSNVLTGGLDAALFSLPAIQSIRANANRLSRLPSWSSIALSSTLSFVYLADNWYPCPLPKYSTLPTRVRSVWTDVNSTVCLRTRTRTRLITKTVPLEPKVLQVVNDTTIYGLHIVSSLNTSIANVSAVFISVLTSISVTDGVLAAGADLSTVMLVNFSNYDVFITFTSVAPLAYRQDVASRFKTQHISVQRLFPTQTDILSGAATNSPTTVIPTAMPSSGSTGIGSDVVIAILVVGIVLVVVFFTVVGFCLCRRTQAFSKAQNLHPHLQPARSMTFSRSKSLRMVNAAPPPSGAPATSSSQSRRIDV